MASVIANEFTEAVEDIYLSSLIEIGLLLFVVTAIINIIGKFIIKKLSMEAQTKSTKKVKTESYNER